MTLKKSKKEYNKEWRLKNVEQIKRTTKEYYLKNIEHIKKYLLKNKKHIKKYHKEYNLKNVEQIKRTTKEYYLKNIEHIKKWRKEYRKEYDLKNVESQRKYDRDHNRKRRRNDPIFKLQGNMRSAMTRFIKGKSKSKSTMEIVGCSVEGLFKHFESCSSWEPWMTRENYGKNGWDVDHIKAISNWNANCPLQFALCWDKSNLQPMEHIANIKKGAA